MKTTGPKCICFLLTLILSGFIAHQVEGKVMQEGTIDLIPPKGWGGGNGFNSMPALSSVSASIDGSLLHIQCTNSTVDITVRIIQNGVTVYQDTVPAADTNHIWIDLSGYEEGMYTLDLTNSGGGHIYGDFWLL
jgi:hypothetical protein